MNTWYTRGKNIYFGVTITSGHSIWDDIRQITELADFWLVATWNSQNDDHAAFQSPNSNQSLKIEDKDAF